MKITHKIIAKSPAKQGAVMDLFALPQTHVAAQQL